MKTIENSSATEKTLYFVEKCEMRFSSPFTVNKNGKIMGKPRERIHVTNQKIRFYGSYYFELIEPTGWLEINPE